MAGLQDAIAKLRSWAAASSQIANAGAIAMAAVAQREVQSQLGTSSHAKGEPTPSAPGSPPALVSGQLRRSVMIKPAGSAHYQVGGTTVYARIQELGGQAGRDHASTLPPRPYLAPALKKVTSDGTMRAAALQVISKMLEG